MLNGRCLNMGNGALYSNEKSSAFYLFQRSFFVLTFFSLPSFLVPSSEVLD